MDILERDRFGFKTKSLRITGAVIRADEQKMGDFKTLLQCSDRLIYMCPLYDEVVVTI